VLEVRFRWIDDSRLIVGTPPILAKLGGWSVTAGEKFRTYCNANSRLMVLSLHYVSEWTSRCQCGAHCYGNEIISFQEPTLSCDT